MSVCVCLVTLNQCDSTLISFFVENSCEGLYSKFHWITNLDFNKKLPGFLASIQIRLLSLMWILQKRSVTAKETLIIKLTPQPSLAVSTLSWSASFLLPAIFTSQKAKKLRKCAYFYAVVVFLKECVVAMTHPDVSFKLFTSREMCRCRIFASSVHALW